VSMAAQGPVSAQLLRRWRDPAAWVATTDVFFILVAVSLPWSTSLVAIFAVAALITMAPFFDAKTFLEILKRPVSFLPVALFLLAARARCGRTRPGASDSTASALPRNS